MEEQNIVLVSNSETREELQCTVHLLEGEIDQLRQKHKELEEYMRRNSLRINNMVLGGSLDPPKKEGVLTVSVLDFINRDVLKGEHTLVERDIERCHFVGKRKASGPPQILVKFARYHDKWKVFSSEKNIKKSPENGIPK